MQRDGAIGLIEDEKWSTYGCQGHLSASKETQAARTGRMIPAWRWPRPMGLVLLDLIVQGDVATGNLSSRDVK